MLANTTNNYSFEIIMNNKDALINLIKSQLESMYESKISMQNPKQESKTEYIQINDLDSMRELIRKLDGIKLFVNNTKDKINRNSLFRNKLVPDVDQYASQRHNCSTISSFSHNRPQTPNSHPTNLSLTNTFLRPITADSKQKCNEDDMTDLIRNKDRFISNSNVNSDYDIDTDVLSVASNGSK